MSKIHNETSAISIKNNKKDSRGKAQSFIYTSDILFTDNSVNRKSL